MNKDQLPCEIDNFISVCLGEGKTIRFHVNSKSMQPAILPGDIIEVSRLSNANLIPGMVIVFWHKGCWVVHRLLGETDCLGERLLLTKGDNSNYMDEPTAFSALAGVVVAVWREGKRQNFISLRARVCGRLVGLLSYLQARVFSHQFFLPLRLISKSLKFGLRLILIASSSTG
jgi:signal peptidase I